MNFGQVLKQCINLTHTKLHVLSKAVGYDTSYLSRFSNGKLIPKGKSALKLCEDCGHFFADLFVSHDLLEVVERTFQLETLVKDNVHDQMVHLFMSAYRKSVEDKPQSLKGIKGSDLLDYVSLVVELQEIQLVERFYICVPDDLFDLMNKHVKNIKRIESNDYFIYVPSHFFYSLTVFEQYQKIIVARLVSGHELREIDLMMKGSLNR